MAASEETVLNLVGMVYDAALDDHKWSLFLEEFAQAVGGGSAMLRSADMQNHKAGFVASVGYDPEWQSAYCNHFVKLDYLTPALDQFKLGEVKTSDQICCLSEQNKTEYFNDYSIPQDKVHALGTQLIRDGNQILTFAAQRGKRAGAFGEEEVLLMGKLAPHVTRAVQMHRNLGSITAEKNCALGALDQLRMGVILADCTGAPLFFNCAAEMMMAQQKVISVCQGRLALHNSSETALLHRLIAGASHGLKGAAAGSDMRITLPNRYEFLQCLVTPVSPKLSAHLGIFTESGCAAIFLSKQGTLQLSPKRLAILYGLSPAESKLVAKLAAFSNLEQTANELGIAIGTARTQLAAVFNKTGSKGQAELLMLLATSTLAHCHDMSGKDDIE